ncbi:MAG: DUF4956 domain-containing protein [Proteobacteria bacterium]|nr:DUF4956 domain-containing protein [Pseudomonadota bacterium]
MSFDSIVSSLSVGSFGSFGLLDVVFALLFPAILSIAVVYTYRKIQIHNSYSPSFLLALYMLAALSGGVTLFIGDNIARAFGLLGAMSIIRFRNALKEPIDAVFVLWTLSLGMASGAGYYLAATCFTVIVAIIALAVKYLGLADFGPPKSIIKITMDGAAKNLSLIEKTMNTYTREYRLLHELHSPEQGTHTKVYTFLPKKHLSVQDIESKIASISGAHITHAMYRPDRPAGRVID